MEFGNPWLIFGLLATAVPVIIWWLFRRRKRQIPLPTIRYLLDNKEQEKIFWQDLILLLLRCLVVALLVLGIARPLIMHGALGGGRVRNVTVLLDGTASMNQQVDVTTAFGLAQRRAAAMIRSLPPGTKVSVLHLGDTVREVVTDSEDLHTAAAQVESLRAGSGAASASTALRQIKSQLTAGGAERAEVYVFSDFQKYTWMRHSTNALETGKDLAELADLAELYMIDVGGQPKFNYMVMMLEPAEYVLSAGVPVRFRAAVECRGEVPPDAKAVVTFLVNGVKKDVHEITPGKQPVVLEFEYRFPGPGEYLLEAVVSGDGHRVDNRRYFLCHVPEDVRVLLLDETAGAPVPDGTYLARAIRPPGHPAMEKLSHFSVRIIHPSRISYENLSEYAVVVLTATETLDDAMVSQMEHYVTDGGALWLFMGSAVNLYEYNRHLFKDGAGLLPCRLAEKVTATRPADGDGQIVHPQYGESGHPALAQFAREAGSKDAAFLRYVSLDMEKVAVGTRVVVKLTNGDPAIIEKRHGQGVVMLTNTTAGADWTYMPALTEYPILIQELLRYLVGRPDASVNLEVGDVFSQPVYVSAQHLLLRMPDGSKVRLTPTKPDPEKDLLRVRFAGTTQQGLYEIEAIQEVLPKRRFVVNQGPQEGDLSRLSEADFAEAFSHVATGWIGPQRSVADFAGSLHMVTELAPWIIAVLAAAMAVESLLAWLFGRRRGEVAP